MTNTKISNTAKRLREIMTNRGLRQRDIVALAAPYCRQYHIVLSKADVSLYVNGKVEPNQGKLFILGKALGVSEAWLMGLDVPMEKPSLDVPVDYVVKSGDQELLVEVERLDPAQKDLLRQYLELLKRSKQ
jgi:transcriptional regulator with XRE-family HTH domain